MKKIVKIAVAAAMVFGAGISAFAQNHEENPNYGKTPAERAENLRKLNSLRDGINKKDYQKAAVYLKDLMDNAPAASSNIYIWGATIYRNKAAGAESVTEKKVYTDSLMLVYDRRVKYFGDSPTKGAAYIRQQKAREYAALDPLDRAGVRKLYREAVDTKGATAEIAVEYFQQLVNGFRGSEIEAGDLIGEHERLLPLMAGASPEEKGIFESLFASSGAASCESLEALFSKELAADPDNTDVLAKAFDLMTTAGCDSDFYVSVAEKYYAQHPSPDVAVRLASAFENRRDYGKALKYLNEMLDAESDPASKSNIHVRIAASELGAKNSSNAAQAARQAILLNPDNGFAHLFLAESYIAGTGGCSGFQASTVFWLAYDELARARQAFAGEPAQQAAVDARMANCRANFPTFEEGFMYVDGYQDGKSYTVNCGWISGTTTIRSR